MTSREYWAKREAEQLKHNITDEAEYDKEVRRILTEAMDGASREIESFWGRYAGSEGITLAEAKKRVSKMDIEAYERKAARYVKTKDFSEKANEEMRLYNAAMRINRMEMLKASIGLELISGADELERFMGGILRGRTEEELARQAGILGKTVKNPEKYVHAIVNGSFHTGTFSDHIWQYQDLMREDLGRLLATGLIQGKNPRALTADLKKYFFGSDPKKVGGMEYCMERLMRTELARVQTEAQKQSFKRNGFDMYEFICNENGHTCPICKKLDGKHFKVEDMMPGTNAGPMHPNCRCSTAAWVDDKEYEAWLDYLEKGGTTVAWNNRLQISQPGNPYSFRKSLSEIRAGKAGLDKRRSNILKRLKQSGDYHRYEVGSISTRDLAYLSAATGQEFALFRSKGEDILIRGTRRNCDVTGDLGAEILERGYEWVAHSHVDGGTLTPSLQDRATLRRLGQKKSILVGPDGVEITFDQSEFGD